MIRLLSCCFNPRAPYRARPVIFSITQPPPTFQSTRPVQGATIVIPVIEGKSVVSIHAPRTGRDPTRPPSRSTNSAFQSTRPVQGATRIDGSLFDKMPGFNPRAPYRARPHRVQSAQCTNLFQSTRPVQGATFGCSHDPRTTKVSIHAPRTGRDNPPANNSNTILSFNPRAPYRARRYIAGHS